MILTLEGARLDVDVRHLLMVADVMTSEGEVRAIGRHGVSGTKHSILARAAFEVTVNHLLKAGIIGERDPLTGVAATFDLVHVTKLVRAGAFPGPRPASAAVAKHGDEQGIEGFSEPAEWLPSCISAQA